LGADDKVSAIANIEVMADLAKLNDLVAQLLPEEKDVKITSVHNTIAIMGTVTVPLHFLKFWICLRHTRQVKWSILLRSPVSSR
jgi:Flp pilus assembly secretin CpaC